MTMMSDLSQDLVEEILSRVPITCLGAVRSTCKGWNSLSKERILCKAEPKQQFIGFTKHYDRLCSVRFNLHGIISEDLVDPSIKPIGDLLKQVKISNVFYCHGLLLCVTLDNSRLVVWNPYLRQIRWIQPTSTENTMYAFGYDKNMNHKILRSFYNQRSYEVYDFMSNSWRVFKVTPKWYIDCYRSGAMVDGNTYFWTNKRTVVEGYDSDSDEYETPDFVEGYDSDLDSFFLCHFSLNLMIS